MVRRTTLIMLLAIMSVSTIMAQKSKKSKKSQPQVEKQKSNSGKFGLATPPSMSELGIHGGYLFVAGELSPEPGFGGGIHFRKALDYIFSLRGDLLLGQAKGSTDPRTFETQWYSASIMGVVSLNSVRFDKSVRKVNWYAMAGGGFNNFEVRYVDPERLNPLVREREFNPHLAFGAGLSFRLGQRVNISLEQQAISVFGYRSDFIDGYNVNSAGERTAFGDILNYSKLGLNFNIGNPTKLTEPLYWINPLEVVLKDISDLKSKQQIALDDSDNDGVLDIVDKEPNTPPDVPVDTKGRTLDSDRDGVADYKDLEPYNPPRPGEVVNEQGVIEVAEGSYGTETGAGGTISSGGGGRRYTAGVTEERVKELIDEALQDYRLTENATSVAEWFLPMIHFSSGSNSINYGDYGTLAGIGKMMKGNNNLKLLVTGFTDETGQETENQFLSYERAKEVVEHLVVYHGIGRGRLILNWKGQSEALVPTQSSYINRRVEFSVAKPSDVEMDPPEGYVSKDLEGY